MAGNGSIRYAAYAKSDRLQRLLAFMLDGKEHSTLDIIQGAEICAVNSAACELRMNGFSCFCVRKSSPAIYQLADPEADRALSKRLLAKVTREEGHGKAEAVR